MRNFWLIVDSIITSSLSFLRIIYEEKVAVFFLLLSIFIILWGFSFVYLGGQFAPVAFLDDLFTNPVTWKMFVTDIYANAGAELFSIALTVLIIDRLNSKRTKNDEIRRLLLQMGSPNNSFALEAIRLLRQEVNLSDIDFSRIDLERADLTNANLASINMNNVFMQRAKLVKANLGSASLRNAKLAGIDLTNADLVLADLTNADLAGANLTDADLTATTVAGANFLEAIMPDGTKYSPNVNIQKFVNLKNSNINWENYPHTVVVQFRTSGGILGLGRIDELAFRHKYEIKLGNLLMKYEIGACDGGQSGAGTSEIFLYTNDVELSI